MYLCTKIQLCQKKLFAYVSLLLPQARFIWVEFELPYIINLKPGLIDTDRVKHIPGNRLSVKEVVDTLIFALSCSYKVHTITFGKNND